MHSFQTADLCDVHISDAKEPNSDIQIASSLCGPLGLVWRDFGAHVNCTGIITTVKCFEDNSLVAEAVTKPGKGKVLVVDAGGSTRCAMLGDRLAQKAVDNDWQGIVIFGFVRDSAIIATMPIAVKALGTHPLKSFKRGVGLVDQIVEFSGVTFRPGEYIYADNDGMLLNSKPLI